MHRFSLFLGLSLALFCSAQEPKAPEARSLTIVDGSGKEYTPSKWKIVSGTRKLAWIDGKPEVLEVREVGSTAYTQGITTYVPLTRLQEITYDPEKLAAAVGVAGLEKPLAATLRYEGFNNLFLDCEVPQGGGLAEVRFKGGLLKGGIQKIKFPNAKPAEKAPEGPTHSFLVPAEPTKKGPPAAPVSHPAKNVKPLYKTPTGEEKFATFLMFKKTLKVEFNTIQSLTLGARDPKDGTRECELKLKDGSTLTVSLLTTIQEEGKTLTLVGLAGEVPAGWRVFPAHCISGITAEKE